jgi:HK97 family phage portal protein
MKVVPGPDGWPEAFEYSANGQSIRFAEDPVPGVRPILHVRLFHPVNDHYGMSPIEAAGVAIDIHNTASSWNKALLDNAARPSGALVYAAKSGNLTGEQYARLKAELEEGFQGARNAGRPLLLEGGLDWKPLSLSPKEMDFVQAKHAAAREIALALGVPPMLLGIPGDNTYSNYQEAQRSLWRQTVLPLVNRTAKAFSAWLSPAFGERLELRPDLDQVEALSIEREALWARLNQVTFLTINEKRAAVGYGPLERDGPGDSDEQEEKTGFDPSQPRVPEGGPDSGQWTGDGGGGSGGFESDEFGAGSSEGEAERVRVAQAENTPKYSIDLPDEDARGGHGYRDHVGKSDEELLGIVERSVFHTLSKSYFKKAQGAFVSLESANDFVNRVLEENRATVDLVASGEVEEMWLEKRFGYPTGKEAFRPGPEQPVHMRQTYNVGVLLRHDPKAARGYTVVTAYPLNDEPK